jgi:N-acetylglutamate synthase-like GNAT family acetyltransferase
MSKKSGKIAALIESFQGRELDAHYLGYFACFNDALYYEAHDVLEELWLAGRHTPTDHFYKGLIQLAGAFVHLQKNRLGPSNALFNLAKTNLEKYPARFEDLNVVGVLELIHTWQQRLESAPGANPLHNFPPPKIAPDVGYQIAADKSRLDVDLIHDFLTHSYWAPGIPRELVQRSIDNSLCFGAYRGPQQIAFARVISDFATFAYLADVFVIPSERGNGVSKRIVQAILRHPQLQCVRRFMLVTLDAQGLYSQFGFQPVEHPERYMAILKKNPYGAPTA